VTQQIFNDTKHWVSSLRLLSFSMQNIFVPHAGAGRYRVPGSLVKTIMKIFTGVFSEVTTNILSGKKSSNFFTDLWLHLKNDSFQAIYLYHLLRQQNGSLVQKSCNGHFISLNMACHRPYTPINSACKVTCRYRFKPKIMVSICMERHSLVYSISVVAA